jgi:uncharacterized protein (TIGR03437 family)
LSVQVETVAGTSAPVETVMQEATPGIFTLDDSGQGQGSILLTGTGAFAVLPNPDSPGHPARPGDVVTILATGLGPMRSGTTFATPFVFIDELSAEVLAVRPSEETPGLLEVEVRVPQNAPEADNVAVTLQIPTIDGRAAVSNSVTLAIER